MLNYSNNISNLGCIFRVFFLCRFKCRFRVFFSKRGVNLTAPCTNLLSVVPAILYLKHRGIDYKIDSLINIYVLLICKIV